MDTGFGNNQLYCACRLTITHYYEPGEKESECQGTGFLVEFPNKDNRLGLVTNRHLVDIPWAKPEREGTVLKSIKAEMWQSNKLRIEKTFANPEPLFHDDPSIDVAIIPFGPEFDPMTLGTPYDTFENIFPDHETMEQLTFQHGLSWEYLLKCERLWPQLRPGELVMFPGYPVWFDRAETRPVLRSGMIASDPHTNYRRHDGEPTNHDGNQQILFDAFSTSGNSGSPVFVAQRGLAPLELKVPTADNPMPQVAAKLNFEPYHEPFLIGINAGHFNEHANDHAGLSRLHKLSAIMEILRANEAEPQPLARNMSLRIPLDNAVGFKPPATLAEESNE